MMGTGCFAYKSNSQQLIRLQTSSRETDLCANNLQSVHNVHPCMGITTRVSLTSGLIINKWCMERSHLQPFA